MCVEQASTGDHDLRQIGSQGHGSVAGVDSAREPVGTLIAQFEDETAEMGNSGVGQGKVLVELDGLLEHLQGIVHIFAAGVAAAAEIKIIGLGIFGGFDTNDFFFLRSEGNAQGVSDAASDFVLDGENVLKLAIIALGPNGMPGGTLDQLCSDAQAVSGAANCAFKDEGGAKLLADLRGVGRLVAESKHFRARKNLQLGDFRKLGDDVFGHAVAEVLVFLAAALIFEVQNGDGFFDGSSHGGVCAGGIRFLRAGPAIRIKVALKTLQVGTEFSGGLITEIGVFLEGFREDIFHGEGQPRVQSRHRSGFGVQDSVKDQC